MSQYDKLFNEMVEYEENTPESCIALRSTVIEFIDFIDKYIIREYPKHFDSSHRADIATISQFFTALDPIELMQQFIKSVLPYSDQIERKNEEYFHKHILALFQDFPQEKVYSLYNFIRSGDCDADLKDDIWDYLQTIVALIKKYKKQK